MSEHREAQSPRPEALDPSLIRTVRGSDLRNVSYHLVELIVTQHGFDDLDPLIEFCEDPNNLHPWLPSEADRIVFSGDLVEGLRGIASGRVELCDKEY